MKNKRTIIALVGVLVLSVIGTTVTYAMLDTPKDKKTSYQLAYEKNAEKDTSVEVFSVRDDAEKERILNMKDGTSVELTYDKTNNFSLNNKTDVYLDSDNNQYLYKNGSKLLGVIGAKEQYGESGFTEKTALSEDELIEIGLKYAEDMFGSDFDNFEFCDFTYTEDTDLYSVDFCERHGENGFIIGRSGGTTLRADGTVRSCLKSERYDRDNFDEKLLDGITEEKIEIYADKLAKAAYGDIYIDSKVEMVELVSINGAYCLEIGTIVEYQSDIPEDRNPDTVEMYYYEL